MTTNTNSPMRSWKRSRTWRSAEISLLALLLCHCESNQQGHLRAQRLGNLGLRAKKRAFDQEFQEACGPMGKVHPTASFQRQPYLQSLHQEGVEILWTTTNSDYRLEWHLASSTKEKEYIASKGARHQAELVEDKAPLLKKHARHEYLPFKGLREKPRQWKAKINGLRPGSLYCYQILDNQVPVYQGAFRSAPPAHGSARFAVLGDVGKRSGDQKAVRDQMEDYPIEAILFAGDLAYERGSLPSFENYFFAVYAKLLANLPAFPASGNHDYGNDARAFREVFSLPQNADPDNAERWYSFDFGPAHIAVVDTEKLSELQSRWLTDDLQASPLPWKIVLLHKPPYSSGSHGSDKEVRHFLNDSVEQNQVDLVIAGHEHNYERSHEIDGVHYLVSGGGGRGTRPVGTSDFTAFSARVAHFVYLEISPNTLKLHAIDATGQEFDSMRLEKP